MEASTVGSEICEEAEVLRQRPDATKDLPTSLPRAWKFQASLQKGESLSLSRYQASLEF